jgi:hypothetical protein
MAQSSASESTVDESVATWRYMSAQLRYTQHGVGGTSVAIQCDLVRLSSRLCRAFCSVVDDFGTTLDDVGELEDWAESVELHAPMRQPHSATSKGLLAALCVTLRHYLEVRCGLGAEAFSGGPPSPLLPEKPETDASSAVEDAEDSAMTELATGTGLRGKDLARRRQSPRDQSSPAPAAASTITTTTTKQLVAHQAQRIAALDEELRKLKERHHDQVDQMESQHRENTRFQVSHAMDQARSALQIGTGDARALRFENASMVNKMKLRETEIDALKARVVELEANVEDRELAIANLEVAMMRSEMDKAAKKEDAMHEAVANNSRIDASIATLNSKVANFAETVLAYATQIREMEVKHTATLRRQAAIHGTAVKELTAMLDEAREAIQARDAAMADLRLQYAKAAGKRSQRMASAARANAHWVDVGDSGPALNTSTGHALDVAGSLANTPSATPFATTILETPTTDVVITPLSFGLTPSKPPGTPLSLPRKTSIRAAPEASPLTPRQAPRQSIIGIRRQSMPLARHPSASSTVM